MDPVTDFLAYIWPALPMFFFAGLCFLLAGALWLFVIRRHELSARKSLGQNFLLDLNLTGRIARAAGPLAGVTVLEIGPGPGGLTRALLAEGANVIAVERDGRAIAALGEIAQHYPDRLRVIARRSAADRQLLG